MNINENRFNIIRKLQIFTSRVPPLLKGWGERWWRCYWHLCIHTICQIPKFWVKSVAFDESSLACVRGKVLRESESIEWQTHLKTEAYTFVYTGIWLIFNISWHHFFLNFKWLLIWYILKNNSFVLFWELCLLWNLLFQNISTHIVSLCAYEIYHYSVGRWWRSLKQVSRREL